MRDPEATSAKYQILRSDGKVYLKFVTNFQEFGLREALYVIIIKSLRTT